jgi:hypothetical protein
MIAKGDRNIRGDVDSNHTLEGFVVFAGEGQNLGCLAGVAAGDLELTAGVEPAVQKRANECSAKFADGNADEAVAQRFWANLLKLAAGLEVKRQTFYGA